MKRWRAPGLPEILASLGLAVWSGDVLGKPGPSEYFSVSPLILESQESFFFFMALACGFYRRTLEKVSLRGKMDLAMTLG